MVDDGESIATASIAIEVLPEASDEPFRRGEVDGGGEVDLSDAISRALERAALLRLLDKAGEQGIRGIVNFA